MKVNYSVTLEAQDIVGAINVYLKAQGVEAEISVDDLQEGLNADMTLDIETSGALPSKAPTKRKRKTAVKSEVSDDTLQTEKTKTSSVKQVAEGEDKEGNAIMRDQTIKEEADESNQKRLAKEAETEITEKVKAVGINDVDEDNGLAEGDAESDEPVKHTAEEIVTNAKNSSVPLGKQGIFKKRNKKVA